MTLSTAQTTDTTPETATAAQATREQGAPPRISTPVALGVGALTVSLVVLALVAPDRTVGAANGMSMTHYMGLLSVGQPWNLLMFMAVPVILAETLAITELVILFRPTVPNAVRLASRWAGLLAGPVMLGILVHLLRYAVMPLTLTGGWRGPADVIAVLAYLMGAVPMIGITLVELGVLGKDAHDVRRLHATFVGVFLVVAHVAMIAGMLDPTVLGWVDPAAAPMTHVMPGGATMPGMSHS